MSSENIFLKSISYTISKESKTIAGSPTIKPGELSHSPPAPGHPKSERSWRYQQTPIPVINNTDKYIPVYCLLYYEDQNKVKRKLIETTMKNKVIIKEAIRLSTSYCESLKKLGKTAGRVYQSESRFFKEFHELHANREGNNPLDVYSNHFFVFDTTGHITKKVSNNDETFPLWNI